MTWDTLVGARKLLLEVDFAVLDQWGQNVHLNKPEFMDLETLYQAPGLNTLARTPESR